MKRPTEHADRLQLDIRRRMSAEQVTRELVRQLLAWFHPRTQDIDPVIAPDEDVIDAKLGLADQWTLALQPA